jgi:hypothetical protein
MMVHQRRSLQQAKEICHHDHRPHPRDGDGHIVMMMVTITIININILSVKSWPPSTLSPPALSSPQGKMASFDMQKIKTEGVPYIVEMAKLAEVRILLTLFAPTKLYLLCKCCRLHLWC